MAFRFTPRQLGLYGKRQSGNTRGSGDTYEPRNLVTQGEVDRMKNSRVTPYNHKKTHFTGAPGGEGYGANTAIQETSAKDAQSKVLDANVRNAFGEKVAEVEAAAPTAYNAEPKKGLISRIFDSIRGAEVEAKQPQQPNGALGTDADGNIVFEEDVIAMLKDERDRRQKERLPLELQWQLNSHFVYGDQYCDINIGAQEIMPYPECAYSDGKQHEVFNRIAPLIETRIANLKKISYAMEVKPATNEMDDYQKAKVSTAILKHTQKMSGFDTKKDTLILWNELCGSCFWLSWWDAAKGNLYASVEETFEDIDGTTAKRVRNFFEGEIDYGLLTPYEVYPESIFKQTVADQRSIIVEQVKTIDEIESLYGIRPEGEDVDTFTLTPTPAAGGLGYEATVVTMSKAKIKNCQKVITYFEKSSKAFPNGRMAILVGEDHLVYYGTLPYDEIPIVRTVCKERAGQFFGKSVIEELIPLQRAYNTACNDIADYLKEIKTPQYLVFEGSVDIEEFETQAGTPGAVLTYRNNPDIPPIKQTSTAFSGDVFTQKYDLERQMEYVAAVSQLMVYGETPNGVTSGTAIESLRDIDNTRLALTGDYIRNSVIEMARLWLKMYKKYAKSYRVIKYTGANEIGNVLVWSNEDITSYDVVFTTENELMFSEQNQWQRILDLLKSGLTDQRLVEEATEKAREFIKSGAYNSELSINELQTQAAARENALLSQNVLPNIRDYDNHRLHAEEHLRYMLQMEFETLKKEKPMVAEAMINHYNEHMAIIQQNAAMQQAAAQQG